MYGRGSYAPPFGQGPQRSMPPYQQQPAGMLFQQGRPFPPPQTGLPPSAPSLASGYPCPPMSQQGPPLPPAPQPPGPPPLAVPGGAPLQRPYVASQNSYSSGTVNPQHAPPPPPPSSVDPPQVPLPPPPYGQTLYGPPVHQPPHNSQQGLQNMTLPPPPPSTYDSAKQSQKEETQMSSVGPRAPPLPPSSQPRPPPPPLSFTSAPIGASMSSSIQSGSSHSSDNVPVSGSTADIATHSHNRDDVPNSGEHLSQRLSVQEDLPPPPPKPADEKIVRNIEILCQFIAKNGLSFEYMARQKESGNPEFKFLFGGEPGSEASCAREYYLWMKKKYGLQSSSHGCQGQMTSSKGLVDANPLVQPNSLTIIGTTHSPADSDVDMEDDITQSEKDPEVDSLQDRKMESILTGDLSDMQKQEDARQYSGDSPVKLGQPSESQADTGMKPDKSSGQTAGIDSPFRMIQNYASEDSSEDDEVKAVAVSPHKSGAISSQQNMDFKNHTTSEVDFAKSAAAYPENVSTNELDTSQTVQSDFHESLRKASSLGECEDDERTGRAKGAGPSGSFHEKYSKSHRDIVEKEDKDKVSMGLTVDEFGRLVKDSAGESESDDAYHSRRRGKRGRSRTCSRSRSPSDRRRRRSPRRKDRRSRSHSWSPKRRRSRSRSPYRPGGDFGGEKPRRDKMQTRQCFDFLKGRCYRGASCRYMHHELDRGDSSRRYKSKENRLEGISGSRISDFRVGNSTSRLRHETNDKKGEKIDRYLDKHDGADMTSKICEEKSKENPVGDSMQPNVLDQGVQAVANVQKSELGREAHSQVQGVSEEAHLPTGEEHPPSSMPLMSELAIHQSTADASAQGHHGADENFPKADNSTRSNSSIVVSLSGLPDSGPFPGKMSSDTTGLSNSTLNFTHQTSHLPPPSLPPQQPSTPLASSLHVDGKLMAPSPGFLPQSLSSESAPPYQAPLSNQQSHYPLPPNPSWSIPPPPRPPCIGDPSIPGAPLPFQQGNPPLRNDFTTQASLGSNPGLVPNHTHVGGFQPQTYQMPAQFTSQGPFAFGSFALGNIRPPTMPFSGDSTVKNMQSTPPSVEPPKPTFPNQTFAPQIPFSYGSQLTATDSVSSYHGGSLPVPGYSSDPLDRDNPTRFLDIGGSRITAHYNPYASTFDKPLTSRFSSTAFSQEQEAPTSSKYDSSAAGSAPGEGRHNAGHGHGAGDQNLPRSAGDQYDPLFDSMEQSSESFKKHARKHGSHYTVLDVEENNKQKEAGAVAAANSLENDEFGETADTEVGAVENASSSNPDEDAIVAEGEIEIDQVKSEGKSKKSKDSRSMKLFKVAVANFVKEVLKPQWRQGNMSKEVFKTIVKKTVEKVSGSMKNRRLPKSQPKIDYYIDSQRRKLTQLVEVIRHPRGMRGYVSKYKI